MATRTITVHDRCTTPGCGRVLHSIPEGECGLCRWCSNPENWATMSRLMASAFDAALAAIKREESSIKKVD